MINANQNDFEPNKEDQGAPQQVQGARKDHKNRGARVEVKDVLKGEKSEDKSDSNKEEPELQKEDSEQRSNYFNIPTDKEYGRKNDNENRAPRSLSFKFNSNKRPRRIDLIFSSHLD